MRLLLALVLLAQAPEFEAVSIKPIERAGRRAYFGAKGGPGTDDPTTWRGPNETVKGLVQTAWAKKFYEVNGPAWTEEDLYEITAKIPPGATKEDFRLMLRSMLRDRFKLQTHEETKQISGYVVTTAKGGPKFHETIPDPNPPAAEASNNARGGRMTTDEKGYPVFPAGSGITMGISNGKGRFHLTKETVAHFGEQLSYQLHAPVNDETGLTGKYDFDLFWDMREKIPEGDERGPDLIQAVREQLGLAFEQKKVSISVIVIDHAERTPTEN
jgi:uncharacterized protein (TIGR03435 family)